MLSSNRRTRSARRDEHGAIAVITALLTSVVLLVVAAFTVDIGNTWARRGQLQTQVDDAAIFAASYLPAELPASKLVAAKAAVHYIACNPVAGQVQDVNTSVPFPRNADGTIRCPSRAFNPTSTFYDAAATAMMNAGQITFPNRFEISVRSPAARVDFGFGRSIGADDAVVAKSATAHVYSPGGIVPMGGSVGCLAAAANNTQLLGLGNVLSNLVPINYFSAGSGSSGSTATAPAPSSVTWPTSPPKPTAPAVLSIDSATVASNAVSIKYTLQPGLTGLLPSLLNSILTGVVSRPFTVLFGRGTRVIPVSAAITVLGTVPPVPIPDEVKATPGDWQVKIISDMPTKVVVVVPTYEARQSTNAATINIGASGLSDLTNLDNLLSCAKPVLSPRLPGGSDSADLVENIRKGVDHGISQHPSLVTAAQNLVGAGGLASLSPSALVNGALKDPTGFALSCSSSNPANVLDTPANRTRSPNCLRVDTTRSWSTEFTSGFLTSNGRLSCTVADCSHRTFSGSDIGVPGTYNDDQITDFITASSKQSVLNDLLLTSLDTFLLPSVPVLTPANTLSAGLYGSPRFFWAPILTTVFTTGTSASYPVLTFRPTFITQEQPSTTAAQKLVNILDVEVIERLRSLVSSGITQLLSGLQLTPILNVLGLGTTVDNLFSSLQDPTKVEKHGLVVDTSAPAAQKLKAVRVMNINPAALPAVDPDYAGPVSDYLGTGPRVIRLVR